MSQKSAHTRSGRVGAPARRPPITEDSAPLATAAKKTSTKTKSRSTSTPAKPDPVDLLRKQVISALEELKAKDVREIDVRGKTSIADLLIIASGTSTRHVKSIADEVVKYAKKAGVMPLGVEGEVEGEWVLVDLGDV